MGRAQFRDTVMLRGTNGLLTLVPDGALVSLYDVGTEQPISATVYADSQSATTLSNPLRITHDAEVEFWLEIERELDLVISHAGFEPVRLTVTTDAAAIQGPPGPTGPQGPQGIQGPTGQGVPVGGTTSQVLQKISNADYATAWVTPPAAVDSALRAYVQRIMAVLDPSGPPVPPP